MKHLTLWRALAVFVVTGCASGDRSVTAEKCECKLVGKYYVDSRNFCPRRFNEKTIELYLFALEEPIEPGASAPPLRLEERLAVNYDAYWAISRVIGVTPTGLGAILFMVGCEEESFVSYYSSAGMRDSAKLWGELGVAEHIVSNYEDSERAFDNALRLEPDYFAKRPIQKRISEAARARRPLQP